MRTEIIKLHKKLATTFIYVTHDQTEAMTMGCLLYTSFRFCRLFLNSKHADAIGDDNNACIAALHLVGNLQGFKMCIRDRNNPMRAER